MMFYDVDKKLHNAMTDANNTVRLKIEIDLGGYFESVFERDIVSAFFVGMKEAAGGVSARGEVVLDNTIGIYDYSGVGPGAVVKVSFSLGEGLPYFQRFAFTIDDRGIQDLRGPGRKRMVRIALRDFSGRLRGADGARDWSAPAVFTYSVACDGSRPGKSLVHSIALRGGVGVDGIDCATVPIEYPFVRLRENVWRELSGLATACRCHLECGPDGRLGFLGSPYQTEGAAADGVSHVFGGDDIFYYGKTERADLYRNTVRLRVNMPVSLSRREIWRYDTPPVFYDENMRPRFPFGYAPGREIERGRYAAGYSVVDGESGAVRPVIFADDIDTREEAEGRLEYEGGAFSYSHYDVETSIDKALLTLANVGGGYLYNASIHGRPIVLDLNRSCFMRDARSVAEKGTRALNVTGAYFTEHDVGGRPHYVDWVARELAERARYWREFTVRTYQGLFNARVGAKVGISLRGEKAVGTVGAFSFRFRRDAAFVSTFRVTENMQEKILKREGNNDERGAASAGRDAGGDAGTEGGNEGVQGSRDWQGRET